MATYTQSSLNSNSFLFRQYEELREQLHSNPELSHREVSTSRIIATHLRALNVPEVFEHIGGTGVAGVFKNGPGGTVLLRSDMDALPILEQAKVAFASTVRQEDIFGAQQPVMHACGHDLHICSLLAATEMLVRASSKWSGTLVVVFQPAEEQGTGARAMLEGGLYDLVPIPDVVLFQHVHVQRAGRIGIRSGPMLAACDNLKITFHGKGGPAALPHYCIDPIIMAANAIVQLQTVVSRETDPTEEMAIVTVGRILAGQAENVIPHTAELGISVRTGTESTRVKVLAAIQRIVHAVSEAGGASSKPDIVSIVSFPPTINDETTVEKLRVVFKAQFGEDFNPQIPRIPASEDFSLLATSVGKPYAVWFIGCTDTETWDEAEKEGTLKALPQNHSAWFNAATQPTLQTGAQAMYNAAVSFLPFS